MSKQVKEFIKQVKGGSFDEDYKNMKDEVYTEMGDFFKGKAYRQDLHMVVDGSQKDCVVTAEVKFNSQLGFPSEEDLMALVATNMPNYQLDWETVEADTDANSLNLTLKRSAEVLPLNSIKDIPAEFTSIGTGIFRRSVTASGKVYEIWDLVRDDDGLSLQRRSSDSDVIDGDDILEGAVVETPYGVGRVASIDEENCTAVVQIGKYKRIVAQDEIKEYDQNKDRKKLIEYYTSVYGKEYAELLLRDKF